MKKILKKLSEVVQIVLLAPIKLPNKILTVVKYVAISLGIIEQVLNDDKTEDTDEPTSAKDED